MNKFEKISNEILNDLNISLPNEFGINEINKAINPKYKWFGMYQILNEYVEEKETTPKRLIEIPGNGYGLYLQNKQFFDMIFNINDDQKISNNILEFIKYIIKPREQDTSIKHILMNFQREYERNNKEISSFKNDPKLKNNINQRINWLNNLLEKISNKSYFQSSEWKENLNLINQDWNNLSINDKMKYDFIHAIIGYLIYNKILFQRNIKQKLTEHFQTFKYRDN